MQLPNSYWMSYTANRDFLAQPRLLARAEGMYYYTPNGDEVLDGTAGLWCCNAGHARKPIVEAVQRQVAQLDFVPPFQFSHPLAFEAAQKITALAPANLNHVFLTTSGSEAVDTALKIALAYWGLAGKAGKTRLIGRERGYHGVGFGGMSVGGIAANRRAFTQMLPMVDHLPSTYNRTKQAFSIGEPAWGAELADELERIVNLHDASTIAAVIIEPMAGSTGVLPPPQGYLQRLRELCTQHNILLIFDEVITGFGRLGYAFAAERYGVEPDMICFAKGVTSGAAPLGGVLIRDEIYEAFMSGSRELPPHMMEFFHGYTFSGHPLCAAAAIAAIDLYAEEDLFNRCRTLEPVWAEAFMRLRDEPNVLDIRTLGLSVGIDLASRSDFYGKRGYEAMLYAFHSEKLMIRGVGDTLALAPPLIVSEVEIEDMVERVRRIIRAVAAE